MKIDRVPSVGRRNEGSATYPQDFPQKVLLTSTVADVLNDGVAENNIKGTVFEWQILFAIS